MQDCPKVCAAGQIIHPKIKLNVHKDGDGVMKKSSIEAVNTRLGSDPPRHSNYSHHAFTKLMLELDPAPCDLPEWRLNING